MEKLTQSPIERNNILNNKYALKEIDKAIWIKSYFIDGEYKFTKEQIIDFFEIDEKTVERYLKKYGDELNHNGYKVLTWDSLKQAKIVFGTDINVGTKTTRLWLFNFKSFLNLSMLLVESEKAKMLRSVILDIVIDTVQKKIGWNTKYINQREDNYLINSFKGVAYRERFKNALKKYVDMGLSKYPIYTNKIYQIVFKENAWEYRKILNLEKTDDVRDTMYMDVLKVIHSLENWIADELETYFKEHGRKINPFELDAIFDKASNNQYLLPQIESARNIMASRDSHFRSVLHDKLEDYITEVSSSDFEKFLGEKSKDFEKQLEEAKDVFKRLKDR